MEMWISDWRERSQASRLQCFTEPISFVLTMSSKRRGPLPLPMPSSWLDLGNFEKRGRFEARNTKFEDEHQRMFRKLGPLNFGFVKDSDICLPESGSGFGFSSKGGSKAR